MATVWRTYPPPQAGYGSQFTEIDRPVQYASKLVNRFVNPGGGLEVRRGYEQLGGTITNVSAPNLKAMHEFINSKGTAVLLAAGAGRIYKLDTSAETTWTQIKSGLDTSAKMRFAQFDDKLIVVNGADRNIYTTDASAFREIVALIDTAVQETTSDTTAHDKVKDSTNFSDFLTQSDVAINDLLFDVTTSAYAAITDVKTSHILHTPLTAGSTGISSGKAAKGGGDNLEIHDLVELNIIDVGGQELDNVALAGFGSSTTKIQVTARPSGFITWTRTDIRVGDYFRNTTRGQIGRITTISGNALQHSTVANQAAGDSLVFLKSAMPIADDIHVHYGRAYYKDSRDKRKIRISGPNDPTDMTSDSGTIDTITFRLGAQQPDGDEIMAMKSFQQYFVMAGKRHVWLFTGTNPIADTTADTADFKPASLFPQGIASKDSVITIGNDVIFLTPDGMQTASLQGSETLPTRQNISDAIREELIGEITDTTEDKILVRHYPSRQWVIAKVSNRLYCYNYSPQIGAAARLEDEVQRSGGIKGSIHVFEGRLAQMNEYFVRSDGDMVMCDSSGRVFEYDGEGIYTDGTASAKYQTDVQTAWLGMDETFKGLGRPSRKQKNGSAIILTTQGSSKNTYRVTVSAPYHEVGGKGKDSITIPVSANNAPLNQHRLPITWRGDTVRLRVETTVDGYDVLGPISFAFNQRGVR